MESSIAVFLPREIACEQLPTNTAKHGLSYSRPSCHWQVLALQCPRLLSWCLRLSVFVWPGSALTVPLFVAFPCAFPLVVACASAFSSSLPSVRWALRSSVCVRFTCAWCNMLFCMLLCCYFPFVCLCFALSL